MCVEGQLYSRMPFIFFVYVLFSFMYTCKLQFGPLEFRTVVVHICEYIRFIFIHNYAVYIQKYLNIENESQYFNITSIFDMFK